MDGRRLKIAATEGHDNVIATRIGLGTAVGSVEEEEEEIVVAAGECLTGATQRREGQAGEAARHRVVAVDGTKQGPPRDALQVPV